jgi:hypothetical protein
MQKQCSWFIRVELLFYVKALAGEVASFAVSQVNKAVHNDWHLSPLLQPTTFVDYGYLTR